MPFNFHTVPSYFLQDDAETDPATFDFLKTAFGIRKAKGETTPGSAWSRIKHDLQKLNNEGRGKVVYKLLFLGRHGEGVHNVAERRYGTKAWDEKWSKLDGDEYGKWVDALLTERGDQQAREACACWKEQMDEGVPRPTSFYSSPLRRCLQTVRRTFDGLGMPKFKVVAKEGLREVIGVHTCDRRSSKNEIVEFFEQKFQAGEFVFENGFAEVDGLWRVDHRETDDEIDARLKQVLDDVFANDGSEVISLTVHSGVIASILRIVRHREFPLLTGGVIPVLVRAEKAGDSDEKDGLA